MCVTPKVILGLADLSLGQPNRCPISYTSRENVMNKSLGTALDTIAAVSVVLLCLLIVSNVISRQFLDSGVPDSTLLVKELMIPTILFPLASATASRAHVAIDFFAQYFPAKINFWIAVFAGFVGLLVAVVLLMAGWHELVENFSSGAEYASDFDIPKWPSRALFVLAIVFFVLRLCQVLWQDMIAAVTGIPAPTPPSNSDF